MIKTILQKISAAATITFVTATASICQNNAPQTLPKIEFFDKPQMRP